MNRSLFLAIALVMCATLSAQTAKNMNDLTAEQKAAAKDVTLTGKLTTGWNSDFRQLRDLCWQLERVDLSTADCPVILNNAFHSRHKLREVVLPKNLKRIGSQSFFACDALKSVVLPASTDSVGASAFSQCATLESLTIEGNTYLGAFAFAGCSNLKTVEVKAAVPPICDITAFEGIDRKKCRLVVPEDSRKLYSKADGWSRFFNDVEVAKQICDPTACLIPEPREVKLFDGAAALKVKRSWKVFADAGFENEAQFAIEMLSARTGEKVSTKKGKNELSLIHDNSLEDDEAYRIKILDNVVTISGRTATGIFRGLTTFEQLLVADGQSLCCDIIPATLINDAPRTHIRELMVDPCRIFIPFEELKAFIPEMARYKYNALHLHLVDDQAWRIEIKKYPDLVKKASSRVGMDDMQMPISGYYTQEQMKELVAYAAKYHIEVVPEIEMPGHEVAAIHAYPQLTCGAKNVPIRTTCGVSDNLLCPGEDFVYEFLGNVFDELANVFPSPYIHLGGDEAGMPPLDCWTNCEKCKALKTRLGITSTDRSENWKLQKYLFDSVIDTLRTQHNKVPMFWYETDFKEIQEGCVTFAWRHGLTKAAIDAAVRNNARIMLCPGEHCYFDYPMARGDMPEVNWGMPTTTLKQTYALDPSWGQGEDFERNNLFGVAGTLWSECINSPERIYYQAYPRAHALSEVGWSVASKRNWEDFLRRLAPTLRDMQRRGISFSMEF